jgi:hypothetical protein
MRRESCGLLQNYVSLRYHLEQPIYLCVPRKEMRGDSFGRGEEEAKEREVGKEQTR